MRIRAMMLAITLMIGSLALAAVLIIPSATVSAEKKQSPKAGSGSAGKCKVLTGPNKGKTGTYTDNGQWCEGDWGGTECKGSDGKSNGKCGAAAKTQTAPAAKATEQVRSRK
ncbi:MAG: hypothetical protein AB7U82_20185 [Blastocatellales bacterium]